MPEQLLWGLLFGTLLAMLAYNLLLLLSLKDVNYLYLVIMVASFILFEAELEGFTSMFLNFDVFLWKEYIMGISFALLLTSIALFTGSFLEIKTRLPKLQPVLIFIVAIWGGIVCLLPFASYRLVAILELCWALTTLVFIIVAMMLTWIKGYRRPALFFFYTWAGAIISLMAVVFVRFGILPSNQLTEKAIWVGFVWMTVVWSLALADRINCCSAETEDANRKLLRSEHQLSQILEGLPIGVVVYGKDRKPRFFNPRFKEIFTNPEQGLQPDLAAGRTLAQALKHFSFRIAGTDQAYPLERLPVCKLMKARLPQRTTSKPI